MSEAADTPNVTWWRAESIRITAFQELAAFDVSRNFWNELGIGEPDSEEKKRGRVTSQGKAADHWLTISSGAGRIDWVYLPNPEGEETLDAVPFRDVGAFAEAAQQLRVLMGPWISAKCPPLLRFAVAPSLRIPVKDRDEGYHLLRKFVSWAAIDPATVSDFALHINRFCKSSAVEGLRVNRLAQWMVQAKHAIIGQMVVGAREMIPFRKEEPFFACGLNLDINSDADFDGKLQPDQLGKLFDEFMRFAAEIAEKGDVP
jgi:hypothetical protein